VDNSATVSNLPFVEKYFHFGSIESSNDFAKGLDHFPGSGIFIVHADMQTKGRGQRGNSFYSGEGGLYATIICPLRDINIHFALNRAVSLAIAEAVEARAAGALLSIKWPNDILWAEKKVCGILLESLNRSGSQIAVGFGINVNATADQFPSAIRSSATSMSIETGSRFDVGELLSDICIRFQGYRFMQVSKAHDRYRKRLYRIGSMIRIGDQRGLFETVMEDGRLSMNVGGKMILHSSGPMYFDSMQ
jgi:BirA family biotin operon repressor/biotin-[acetyl-CoA-carboxylase] ligase